MNKTSYNQAVNCAGGEALDEEVGQFVPLDALPSSGGVLGDSLEIVSLNALSELTVADSLPRNAPSVLSMGGISYDGEPVNLDNGLVAKMERPSNRGGASLSALRGSKGRAYEWTFGRLPGTRGEAEVVGEYFLDAFEEEDAPEPMVLTRRKASRDAFEKLAPTVRFLHLATHGWFAPESVASTVDDRVIDENMGIMGSSLRDQVIGLAPSLLCGLAFAGANGAADMYGRVRGVMTAEEISAMDLSGVELCVLSACQTNVGLRRGGQGIASLQTALHAAGVRTAITSLWMVSDEATRELMTEFYRRLWVLKEPKAQALWNAKRKLREQLDADGEPVYSIRDWAGWVLSGDPD
ncbi:MAG: CHAT domain-containing protein [Planctomycetota bacterium]